ncbi:hypothetical protein [Dyadobacter sp. 32]|uniref:hypothetical protein n=1 Tax=Dyadobacter sp. 32 TaxID=538966 RepID=UPI0011EBA95E
MKLKSIERILVDFGAESKISKSSHGTVFWGVAPTGDIHIGYLPYLAILKSLKSSGTKILIFIGDFHAYLDDSKTKFDDLRNRSEYYKSVFISMGFEQSDIICANDVYFTQPYINLVFKFSNYLPTSELLLYAGLTLRHYKEKNYSFGDLLYVATQIADIDFFCVDLVLCGDDEAGIYKLGLPIINKYSGRDVDHIYLKVFPGVTLSEMHASDDPSNKISIHESLDNIEAKLKSSPILLSVLKKYLLPLFGYEDVKSLKNVSKKLHQICHGKF